MSILEQLASTQGRHDEIPNQELAAKICQSNDDEFIAEAIQELADNLKNAKKAIRHDCIKVLYEIGASRPSLIEAYVDEFLQLLRSKDNRMVWGAMTALGSIAEAKAEAIWKERELVMEACRSGSVITQDWGIRVIAIVANHGDSYAEKLLPFLLQFLKDCPAKDLPRHAESILFCIKITEQKDTLRSLLEARQAELNNNQAKRIITVLKRLQQ